MINILNRSSPNIIKTKKLFADMGYLGQNLKQAVASSYGIDLEIVKRPCRWFYVPKEVTNVDAYLIAKGHTPPESFTLLHKRWIVERTFAWLVDIAE